MYTHFEWWLIRSDSGLNRIKKDYWLECLDPTWTFSCLSSFVHHGIGQHKPLVSSFVTFGLKSCIFWKSNLLLKHALLRFVIIFQFSFYLKSVLLVKKDKPMLFIFYDQNKDENKELWIHGCSTIWRLSSVFIYKMKIKAADCLIT